MKKFDGREKKTENHWKTKINKTAHKISESKKKKKKHKRKKKKNTPNKYSEQLTQLE